MNIRVNALNYSVDVLGQGEPLMLLHGFTGSSDNWHDIAEALRDDYRVILVDLPGHGATESPEHAERYRIEATAADLMGICDVLEIEQVNLWGYSMGGRLALYTALHHQARIRSLMLESASPGLADEQDRVNRVSSDAALAESIEREGIVAFVNRWESLSLWESQKHLPLHERERLRELRLRNNPHGLANSLRGMGTGMQPSLWGQLDTLNSPVLIAAGKLDTKFVEIAEQMHAHFPASALHIVPNAGHTVHLERPEVIVNLWREFIESL